MVYTEEHMTWAQCDRCTFTMFAGFDATPSDVKGLSRWGWTFGKRVLCPSCSETMREGKKHDDR